MTYDFGVIFTDEDHGWGWQEHLSKLAGILRPLTSFHPWWAKWYRLYDSPETSFSHDLLAADVSDLANVLQAKNQGGVGFRILFWNGRPPDNFYGETQVDEVTGTYFAGGGNQTLFKHRLTLEITPLPVPPRQQIDAFIFILKAVVAERTVSWGELTTTKYMREQRVFPHRRCGGWMVYVPKILTAADIPQASELIDIDGKGTAILSTRDPFDDSNPAHVKAANDIDIRLLELGLLPEVYG